MSPEYLAIAMFGVLLILVLTGFPIAFALASLALVFGLVGWGSPVFHQFTSRIFGTVYNEVLPAVPLFIFMGCMLERSGIAERLYKSLYWAMGPIKGGLAIATVVICTLFAACTGIIGASVTTMGMLALPPMLKRFYDKPLATGSICAGGTLGILIPPSIMLILYGPMAGLSVSKLFMAAIIPGLLLSGVYILYIAIRSSLQPGLALAMPIEERAGINLGKVFGSLVVDLISPAFLILAVLGSIFFGICDPVEAAGLGALGAILISVAYRRFNWKTLGEASYVTLRVTSMVMFVVLGATMFTGVFMGLGGDKVVEQILLAIPFGRWAIFAAMMFIIFILGMFLDWIGILYVIIPMFTPIGVVLGFNPLWFAMVICVNLQLSFLTPPFAYAIFYLKGVAPPEVTLIDIYRGVLPFIGLQAFILLFCILFPELILWLPSIMAK